ncbi:uncharacterized protein M6B38_409665 [Iris pallida]|uniref:Uncharacterized protein n=1 Tax=Iris pallida TaxID=29817 RepID=A0AAX6FN68_IRIPA|nr:uncharacterized protein M6B38_409665 [Iris pallida]
MKKERGNGSSQWQTSANRVAAREERHRSVAPCLGWKEDDVGSVHFVADAGDARIQIHDGAGSWWMQGTRSTAHLRRQRLWKEVRFFSPSLCVRWVVVWGWLGGVVMRLVMVVVVMQGTMVAGWGW